MIRRTSARCIAAWRETGDELSGAIEHLNQVLVAYTERSTATIPPWRPGSRSPRRFMVSLLLVFATFELAMGVALLAAWLLGNEVVIAAALGSMGGLLLSEIAGGRR